MKKIKILALFILNPILLFAQNDSLFQNFQNPPQAAKPRVWWHWMNGNVSINGITKDLEWMKRVGIGGVQMFEANLGTPRLIEKSVIYGNDEWKKAIKHTAKEIKRLDLEFTLAGSGGWSQTGGPQVLAQEAMKKIVWSETQISSKNQTIKLPLPPNATGEFQDTENHQQVPFYKDFAVLAYQNKEQDIAIETLKPKITSSDGAVDLALLNDNLYQKSIQIKAEKGTEKAWIQYEFEKPIAFKAVTLCILPNQVAFFALEATGQILASNDGETFTVLTDFPNDIHRPSPVRSYTLGDGAYRFYKIEFKPLKRYSYDLHADILNLFKNLPPITFFKIAELKFHTTQKLNQWQDKAAYGLMFNYNAISDFRNSDMLHPEKVLDLTAKMKPDGTINWENPTPEIENQSWTILRMGYSLTGHQNGPAPAELTGLEVDKLNKKHVLTYIEKRLAPYLNAMGEDKDALSHVLLDSWEAEVQNWTEEMLVAFEKRNAYSAIPFLPVLAGKVVGNIATSERFLWDFRATISDLIAENHYETIANYLHSKNIKLYGEAIGASLGTMGEGLKSKSKVDIPMGEFWTPKDGKYNPAYEADILEAASAAHIYSKNLVAAESFTDDNYPFGPPSRLKSVADYYMSLGVNRFVVHTSVHQPWDDKKPGMTLIFIGQHYTRHNTWAEQSKAWNQYLGRCSYMLQQGQSTNDIAYFVGEDAPATSSFWSKLSPEIPEGLKFDLVNKDLIINQMRVKNGEIVIENGLRYKMLVFPNTQKTMTLPLLKKIKELVASGAKIYCPKPETSPSLSDFGAENPIAEINLFFGNLNGNTITQKDFSKGKLFWGGSLSDIFKGNIEEDLIYTKPNFDTKLNWIHRKVGATNIYFISNPKEQSEEVKIRFSIAGFLPEIWHIENGEMEKVAYETKDGFTTISKVFEANESVFVVFREKTEMISKIKKPYSAIKTAHNLDENWRLEFPKLFDNTTKIDLNKLTSWTDLNDSTLNYFSGTATYHKSFQLKKDKQNTYFLDLGDVRELAEVTLNGKNLGILWHKPFQINISDALKTGKNELEIKVTNLWSNRMFGDTHLPLSKQYTWALNKNLDGSMPNSTVLLPSGLLGGVTIKIKK